jgi:hypothetical protein
LGDRLEAVSQDVDGDGFDDILVRQKGTQGVEAPYIINGYTTADSAYPYRNQYYTKYPTRADRKNKSYGNFINDVYGGWTEDYGLKRGIDPNAIAQVQRLKSKGYKQLNVRTDIPVAQVFKTFIFKPVMNALKAYMKNAGIEFVGDKLNIARVIRSAEVKLRYNLVTGLALEHIFGNEVFNFTEAEIKKLQSQKIVKQASQDIMRNLSQNRNRTIPEIVSLLLDFLVRQNVLADGILELGDDVINFVAQSPEWIEPEMNASIEPGNDFTAINAYDNLDDRLNNVIQEYLAVFPEHQKAINTALSNTQGDPGLKLNLLNELQGVLGQEAEYDRFRVGGQ